jgi:hypothetical protein
MRSAVLRPWWEFVAAACVLLLAGCSGGGSGGADDGSAASARSTSPAAQLSDGLLPPESFGPGATVAAVSGEQLRAGSGPAALGTDVQITPEACAAAVGKTQPDVDAYEDVAGLTATAGSTVTVEMLMRGGPTEGSAVALAGAAGSCPRATVTSPRLGQVTVDFENLPVSDLGDAAAAMRYTTSVSLPDGTLATVPALVGAVEDGDRLLVLVSLPQPAGGPGAPAPGGAAPATSDPAAFTALLEKAYEVQAEALG